jgi:methyl-accepting chemotaxis protein
MIREISQKTKVINEIVFQTKLLSFNASVEAARAGEHGRGFAVVAEEVGNLAAMSGKASQEIDHLLSESVRTTEGIVQRTAQEIGAASDAGRATLENGMTLAARCGDVLIQLASQAEELKNRMASVLLASKEQSLGIENISVAMEKIRESTAKNADNAGVADEVSDSLLVEAKNLSTVVEYMERALFGRDVYGAAKKDSEAPLKKAS